MNSHLDPYMLTILSLLTILVNGFLGFFLFRDRLILSKQL